MYIIENYDDLAGYYDTILDAVESPDCIIKGYGDARIGLKKIEMNKFVAVVHKEMSADDGFVITAYSTNRLGLDRELNTMAKTAFWKRHHLVSVTSPSLRRHRIFCRVCPLRPDL